MSERHEDAKAGNLNAMDAIATLFGYNGTTYDRLRSAADNGDALAVSTLGILRVLAEQMVFNGTTWDRARGDVTNGMDVDVTRLPTAENHVGEVGYPVELITVTPVLDTSAYATGDVLWTASVALTSLLRTAGGKGVLRSVTVIDEDDQGIALDLFFFKANQSLGTVNGAPSLSDAATRDCLGFVSIAAGDYIDLGGARVAHKSNLASVLTATASRDVYLAGITRGAPTYTASGLKISVGVENG